METDAFKLHKFKEPMQEEIEALNGSTFLQNDKNSQILNLNLNDDLNGISQDKPVSILNFICQFKFNFPQFPFNSFSKSIIYQTHC